jgi:septum formation topological specificity factor MinE
MNEIKILHSGSESIRKLLNKLVIYVSLFNSDNEYNEILFLLNSLKKEILDLQKKYIKIEVLDIEVEEIYGKNLLVFSEINKLLQNEKMKIIKAA